MAADVAGDVVLAQFPLDELHGGEDRPLRTARAEGRRARMHLAALDEVEGFLPALGGVTVGR